MNDTQEKELVETVRSLIKKCNDIEKDNASLRKKLDSQSKEISKNSTLLSNLASSIKRINTRIIILRERLSSAESTIRSKNK